MTDSLFDAADTIGKTLNVEKETAAATHAREQKNAVEKAQELYKNSLRPIFNALTQLPEKDGKKFEISESFDDEMTGVGVYLRYGDQRSTWASIYFKGENPGENDPVTIYFNSRFHKKEFALHDVKDAAALFSEWVNNQLPDRILDINAIAQAVKEKANLIGITDPETKKRNIITFKYS